MLHRLDDGAVARPAAGCAAAVDSLAPDVAAAQAAVLRLPRAVVLHCSAFLQSSASSTSSRTSPRRRRGEQSQGMLKPAVQCSSRPCVVVGEELA